MNLTDTACKTAKPTENPRKLADGGGLYLEVMPSGSKCWRMKFRFLGKEKRLAVGVYTHISLAEASARRDQAKKLPAQGTDPSDAKRDGRKEAVRNIIEAQLSYEAAGPLGEAYNRAQHLKKRTN